MAPLKLRLGEMVNYLNEGRAIHTGKYRPDIDGIRAIAVTSVVLSHAYPSFLPGGFVGVDIFFVISGYLISNIIIRELNAGHFSLLSFYDRRIRRIFPALAAVLLFTLAFGWFCLFRPEFKNLGAHIVASTLFFENILLWKEVGYFDVSSNLKPTLHLWSLAIEEQFYILWPLLMYVAHRLRINFVFIIILLACASFAINIRDIHQVSAASYYSPFGRSWELMIGSGLALVENRRIVFFKTHNHIAASLGALLILIAFIVITPANDFPGVRALLPTLGTFLLLGAGENAWFNRRFLTLPPLVWCGLVSYPLYLWHWPFLSFGHYIFGDLSVAKATACVIAALSAAGSTYYFIERPIRRNGGKRKAAVLLTSFMVSMLIVGVLVQGQSVSPRLWSFDAPTGNEWDILSTLRTSSNSSETSENVYSIHAERKDQVLFLGDSHMAQYASRVSKMISEDPQSPGAVFVVLPACIPIEGWGNNQSAVCRPLRAKAYAMAEEDRFKTVVIGGAWNIYMSEKGQYFDDGKQIVSLVSSEGRQLAMKHLQRRIDKLISLGKNVVLILDGPVSDSLNPTGPRLRLSLNTVNFEANGTTKIDPRILDLHAEFSSWARQSGARVIDPMAAVCTRNICKVTTETGQPLYRNRDHFNPAWAVSHASFVDEALIK